MNVFVGTKSFLVAYKNRKKVPMSYFWKWLMWKWKHDLIIVFIAVINPHLIMAVIISIFLEGISRLFKLCARILLKTPSIKPISIDNSEKKMRFYASEFRRALKDSKP